MFYNWELYYFLAFVKNVTQSSFCSVAECVYKYCLQKTYTYSLP